MRKRPSEFTLNLFKEVFDDMRHDRENKRLRESTRIPPKTKRKIKRIK